ncbi:MAG TPA: flagellar basal body P-ring formation protein FlgA [Rhodobacteraceae bacterium]|nr:flagellar basal body P-ring formation protein FlgA [Paracoccaceae bacterium]
MIRLVFILALLAAPAAADTLVAARTVRSHAIITPADITIKDVVVPGALTFPEEAIGQEARVVLYAGRPIRPGDIGPAAIVDRNQIVRLIYKSGSLQIIADGRSLGRGGVGDYIRVMNLSSRTTVSGIIAADGSVTVGN